MKKIKLMFLILLLFNIKVGLAQDGTLDPTFDGDGRVVTSFDNYSSSVNALAIQPDGKIIAAGSISVQGYGQFALSRYNSNGSLDTTFGTDGKAIATFSGLQMILTSIALQPDGKIMAGGFLYEYSNGSSRSQFALVRYNSNGNLDTTFGVDGKVITSISEDSDRIVSVILQSDGKIIASGSSYDESSYSNFVVARYLSDGSLDTDFGVNGIAVTSIRTMDYGHAVALQPDGKIIFAGESSDVLNPANGYDYDFAIVRYTVNGILDTSFGNDGKVILSADGDEKAMLLKIQTDGKILVVGDYKDSTYALKLARLLANGSLDADFGTGGIVTTVLPYWEFQAVEMQIDGKIVTTQSHGTGGCCSADIKLTRFLANGDFDTTFGNNGIVTTDFINENSQAHSIVMQQDGKIVIGGGSANQIHADFALSRFNSGLQLANSEFNILKNTFSVYPNPVNETINLDFNLNESRILSMDLYDSNGRKIANLLKEKDFQTGHNFQKLELPETLSKGVYFLNISNGKNSSNIKIVK